MRIRNKETKQEFDVLPGTKFAQSAYELVGDETKSNRAKKAAAKAEEDTKRTQAKADAEAKKAAKEAKTAEAKKAKKAQATQAKAGVDTEKADALNKANVVNSEPESH